MVSERVNERVEKKRECCNNITAKQKHKQQSEAIASASEEAAAASKVYKIIIKARSDTQQMAAVQGWGWGSKGWFLKLATRMPYCYFHYIYF